MVKEYLSAKEAAEYLSLSVSRIYHLKHKLPHIKCGESKSSKVLFIREKLIDAYQTINIVDAYQRM